MIYNHKGNKYEIDLEQDGSFSCYDIEDMVITGASPDEVKEKIRAEIAKTPEWARVKVLVCFGSRESFFEGTAVIKPGADKVKVRYFDDNQEKEVMEYVNIKHIFGDTSENREQFKVLFKANKAYEKAYDQANVEYQKLKRPTPVKEVKS